MSQTDNERSSASLSPHSNSTESVTSTLSDAAEQGGGLGQRAKDATKSFAADAKGRAVHMLDSQVTTGASLLKQIADAARAAGSNLEETPFLAGVVNRAADRVDCIADDLKEKSFSEIVGAMSEFTRRRPALVFGAAAICGFMLLRVARVDPDRASSASTRHNSKTI